MKPISILIILIVNAILWNLIDSVKNNKDQNELTRVTVISKNLTKMFNDAAESSVQKSEGMLEPNANKGTKINNKKKREINRIYYQNNKEKIRESNRIYCQNNREKRRELDRKYRQNNKEKKRERNRKYCQNNKEKKREWNRKYRENRKNKKADLRNDQSDNGETSFVNTQNDFRNKGKLPIVYEENIRSEGNLANQGEEEDNDETATNLDGQNQQAVEEANMNQIDLNEKYYPFDLNKKPEGVDEDV